MNSTKKRVLVVDDDPALRRLVQVFLAQRHHAVEAVGCGRAALERLEREHYDLVCLDLTLPDISGFDVVERLARGESPVPVLMISARATPIDRAHALEAGAADYLAKPFTLTELGAQVDALLAVPPRDYGAGMRQAMSG